MKTFKYRWKIGNNEFVGARDVEDHSQLETHVKNVGGELVEIISVEDKVDLRTTRSSNNSNRLREESYFEEPTRGGYGPSYSDIPMKNCPYCAEKIMREATVCRYCGRVLYARKGWGRIGCGVFLYLFGSSSIAALIAGMTLGPLGVFVSYIIHAIAIVVIISGVYSLLTPTKKIYDPNK